MKRPRLLSASKLRLSKRTEPDIDELRTKHDRRDRAGRSPDPRKDGTDE